MIDHLKLENYKSARSLEIPFGSLTVLSGFNGSGKSSVLQAISLIRQSIDKDKNSIDALHLRGNLIQLGQGRDVISAGAITDTIAITLTNREGWSTVLAQSQADLDVLPARTESSNENKIIKELGATWFQYIEANRLIPRTHYERGDSSTEQGQFLGTHGQFTPAFLAKHSDSMIVSERRWSKPQRANIEGSDTQSRMFSPKLGSQIEAWFQHLSPGVRIHSDLLKGTDLASIRFSYSSGTIGQISEERRPGNVGFGLTYSLPIITSLLAAPPGSLLLLENPEAHLHPRGQAALGGLMVKCANDGVQIIVETHSDHILNGIRIASKNSGVDPFDSIRICNFTRDADSGDSYIETPRVLLNGELTAWPDGFFDEWEKSLEELLR